MVTITGSGGVGKTSLAFAVADPAGSPTTVAVCELAEVDSPDAVRYAVAARLNVQPRPGMSIREPGRAWGARRCWW